MKINNRICRTALAFYLVALLFSCLGGAFAPTVVQAYLSDEFTSAASIDDGDWYFGENYLNIEYVKTVVNGWKADEDFDWEGLEADPVKIAVVDSGIGCGYIDYGAGTEAPCTDYYGEGIDYRISPFFDDVLLKENGNIVYKNVGTTMHVDTNDHPVIEQDYVYDSGEVAKDLADNAQDNHGTHVTSTVGILIKALGLENYIKIIPIKANSSIYKSGTAVKYTARYTKTNIEKAVNFAVNKGADVINLSLASSDSGFTFSVNAENSEKPVVVAAAGNDGLNAKRYPAASDDVLGVMNYAAGTSEPTLASSSNYGSSYDICAPGTSITALIDGKDGYGTLSGTSMASPIASFASALLKLRYRANNELHLTSSMIRELIPECASDKITKNGEQLSVLDLTAIATADFASDKNYSELIIGEPEAIYVSTPSNQVLLGDSITLDANYFPKQSVTDGKVIWYRIKDSIIEKFAEGIRAIFTPDSVGTYSFYCSLEQDGLQSIDAQYITVYSMYNSLENVDFMIENGGSGLSGLTDVTIESGSTMDLSLHGIEFLNPNTNKLKWYIDGYFVSGEANYHFAPLASGRYEVSAKVSDQTVASIIVNVTNTALGDGVIEGGDEDPHSFGDSSKERVGMIVTCAIVGSAMLIEIGFTIYYLYKKRNRS